MKQTKRCQRCGRTLRDYNVKLLCYGCGIRVWKREKITKCEKEIGSKV